jgi:hypothetical protein
MRLVDTFGMIEWLMDSPRGKALAAEMGPCEACLGPTIVQLELAKWLSRERSDDDTDRVIAYPYKQSFARFVGRAQAMPP